MTVILLANGFEEVEALTPIDILRRAGVQVVSVGIGEMEVVGAHGIRIVADTTDKELDLDKVENLILPGGMPGTLNLDKAEITDAAINRVLARGGHIAAICAAPLILGKRGLLRGKRATCYPSFEDELVGASVMKDDVVTDGNITTASGMEAALPFAKELARILKG